MTKKAIIVCTWDWYYYSHRRNISKMFLEAGYEVIVVTKIINLREEIESDGVRIIDVPFSRASLNPFRELGIIWRLRRIYAKEKPDIVYHVA
ncbi:glycosyltransferase, partial [Pirellulaceae bacterium]|nr:glycosyltransferase [Pirellulaceae bacterium]